MSNGRNVTIAGACAAIIAPFLTWVHIAILGDYDLFNLIAIAKQGSQAYAIIPMLIALAAIIARRPTAVLFVAAVIGLIYGLILKGDLNAVRHSHGFVTVGIGPWVGMGGAIAIAVGAITGADRPLSKAEPPPS
jgi:hypothetical protein